MDRNCLILLVEDDVNDAFFIERALKKLGFPGNLLHLENTNDAKAFVLGTGRFADREKYPLPKIIVADSAVTVRDSGVEFLEWVNLQENGKGIPFIILSGGVSEETRLRAEAAGVRKIMQKGSNVEALMPRMRAILQEFPMECREWLK